MSVAYLMPKLRLEPEKVKRSGRVEPGTAFILGHASVMRCFSERQVDGGSDQVMVELVRMGRRSAFFIEPGETLRPIGLEDGELRFSGIEYDSNGRLLAVHIRVLESAPGIHVHA